MARAYTRPAALSAIHPASRAARKPPSDCFIGLILALVFAAPFLRAEDPPPNLPRLIAHQETEARAARAEYNYRQTVAFAELNEHGGVMGEYREERDVILSPENERTEHMVGKPLLTLKRIQLTDEDFADMRNVQPFVMTEDQLWNYETKFRGEENIDGEDCWVLQIRPRQILQGQRLFDGMIWASKKDFGTVRLEGRAVPQILSTRTENLFPRFVTQREKVDGKHRFPVYTFADDTLPFRGGLQRVRMTIRYTQYKKFRAESVIQFEKP